MRKLSLIGCLLLFVATSISAKIVFYSGRGGDIEIYVMDNDGSNVQRLTNHPQADLVPRWSPSGKQIAFMRTVDGAPGQQIDIFVMNADGSDEQRVTTHPASDLEPAWAPDGKRIAFISMRSGQPNMHVINLVSQKVQQLTYYKERQDAYPTQPDWSPDGKHIVYTVDALPEGEWSTIYIMDANGKRQKPLLKGEGTSRYKPRWSPDSRYIMYGESEYGPQLKLLSSKIVIRHRDGRFLRERRMPDDWLVDSACWTENRDQVLITAQNPELKYDIYRYDLTNGKMINLTNHPGGDLAQDYWWKDITLNVAPAEKKSTQWGQLKISGPPSPFKEFLAVKNSIIAIFTAPGKIMR